jgi:hypothetical protein
MPEKGSFQQKISVKPYSDFKNEGVSCSQLEAVMKRKIVCFCMGVMIAAVSSFCLGCSQNVEETTEDGAMEKEFVVEEPSRYVTNSGRESSNCGYSVISNTGCGSK